MPRYNWHVITDPNKIVLFTLGGLVRTQAPSKGDEFHCGEIAFSRNNNDTYFRLGGKCSTECKAWYAEHGKYKENGEIRHYTNAGERNKRKEKYNG